MTTEKAIPLYHRDYARTCPTHNGSVKVATWNINHGQNVDVAIDNFTQLDAFQDVDILLLQEMDEVGTDAFAQSIGYNFIYFPAVVHPKTRRNFGNAILSRWPIAEPERVPLPHKNPIVVQDRIAVRSTVKVGETDIHSYSIHTETISLRWAKRLQQFEHIGANVDQQQNHILVGGDFNTPTRKGVRLLAERMAAAGLERVSADAGATFLYAYQGWTLDHIFARGLSVTDSGVVKEATASDHLPLWVQLSIE